MVHCRRIAVGGAVLIAALLPGTAGAATLSKPSASAYQYRAASGEANRLEISRLADGRLQLTDSGATIAVAASASACVVAGDRHTATCPGTGITALTGQLDDRDDSGASSAPIPITLYGGWGTDTLTGGPLGDKLYAGGSFATSTPPERTGDVLTGNGGDDVLDATHSQGAVLLEGGAGRDQLRGSPAATVPPVDEYQQWPRERARFHGGAGNDVVTGSGWDDFIDGGPGADDVAGGDGFDVGWYGTASTAQTIDVPDGAANDGGTADAGVVDGAARRDKVFADVEAIVGGSGNDVITATDAGGVVIGGPGDDTLNGGVGDDTLCGDDSGRYDQPLYSCYVGYPGNPEDGDDVLDGGPGDDRLIGYLGDDVFDGGPGRGDAVSYPIYYLGVVASIGNTCTVGGVSGPCADDGLPDREHDTILPTIEVLTGAHGDDRLVGSDAGDRLYGGGGGDTLVGNGGSDLLCGGYIDADSLNCNGGDEADSWMSDTDRLSGGAGNDLLSASAGSDTFEGGTGVDTVSYAYYKSSPVTATIGPMCAAYDGSLEGCPDDGIQVQVDRPVPPASEGDKIPVDVENVTGGGGADHLTGSSAYNVLTGLGGNDTLAGAGGNDTLKGDAGADRLDGGAGSDWLRGGADGDLLAARDRTRDQQIDCGDGADSAYLDGSSAANSLDPEPVGCETRRYEAPPAP